MLPVKEKTPFTVTAEGGLVKVATSAVTATVDPATGKLNFTDAAGKTLLASGEGGKMAFAPIEVEGKKAFSTQVVFDSPADEAFYGLGQQQTGEFDHKGLNEELYQYNTKISIPFVVSSKGYGLLFDAYSWSRWGNPNPFQQLGQVFKLYDKDGVEGALTGTYVTRRQTLVQREEALEYDNERLIGNLPKLPLQGAIVTYEGEIEAPVEGDYYFSQYYAGFQNRRRGDDVPPLASGLEPQQLPLQGPFRRGRTETRQGDLGARRRRFLLQPEGRRAPERGGSGPPELLVGV